MPTTPQQPIGSGFDADSRIAEVLADVDLTGRLAVVTGGYSGIGTEVTRGLSAAGATVIVPARRPALARSELAGVERVEIEELDLADLHSVAGCAARLRDSGRPIDMLINNAAIMANELTRVGPEGWESQIAVDHLGHFALTIGLWPALVAGGGARVVSVSSRGHQFSDIRWDDLQWRTDYDKWQAYGQAKMGWVASTSSAATSLRSATPLIRTGARAASHRTQSTQTPPDACGMSRYS